MRRHCRRCPSRAHPCWARGGRAECEPAGDSDNQSPGAPAFACGVPGPRATRSQMPDGRRSPRSPARSITLTSETMPSFSTAFSYLQKIGKCMMLPVPVLAVAGILLGVGSANFTWLPQVVSQIMAQSGGAIFSNLPLLFAIGVAIGLTENDGVAALAGAVGWFVFLAAIGVCAKARGIETTPIMGIPSIDTGVFGGIIVGLIAARAFNRFYKVQLPSYLGFFAGKRSVPIITAFEVILLGALLSFIWPPIGNGIKAFSNWAAHGQPALAFTIYGIVERALIPFGLHHVWNVPFFFQAGDYLDPTSGKEIHGEISRFIAGDPTAGKMTGGYLFKIGRLEKHTS